MTLQPCQSPLRVLEPEILILSPAPQACSAVPQVSMLDGELFDKLETVARATRGSLEPFGGIQLVLSGDFHQLPPVARGRQSGKRRQAAPVNLELGHPKSPVNLPGHTV